jgi:Uma2 family endonuclease
MNIPLRRPLTVADYLAWADSRSEPQRTELINGQVVPMPPERLTHNRVKNAVYLALIQSVRSAGIDAEVLSDGMAVRIDEHTAYEPDALIYCGEKLPDSAMLIADPVVVVEVLSPSTAHSDTSAKLIGYFKLPSVAHYLVLDPATRSLTHHARGRDPVTISSGRIELDPPGLSVAVEDSFEMTWRG